MSRQTVITLAAIALVGAMCTGLWWAAHQFEPDPVMAWIENAGPWAFAIVIALMILHNVVPIPAEIIAVCAGMALGPWLGILSVWLGAMGGAVLAFWLARAFGRDWVEARLPLRHRAKLARATDSLGAGGLLTARLIPLIAFNLVNYGAGLTRVGWGTYLWTTAIGILPMIALTVFAGAKMPAGLIVWAMVAGVGLTAIWLVWRGLMARRLSPADAPAVSPSKD